MEPNEMTRTLEQIEGLRLETRRNLQTFWFPMVLFGSLTLVAGVAAVLAAVPLVMLAVAPGSACTVTAAVVGSVLLGSGLAFRRTQAPTVVVTR